MKTLKKLTILSLSLLVFSCKNEIDEIVFTKPENKINFQTIYPKTEYSVQINPNATLSYPSATDQDTRVLSNGLVSIDHGNFMWLLKPVANSHWSFKNTTTITMKFDMWAGPGAVYKLDQVLLPSDSQGATNIVAKEALPTAVSNPLKVSVEYWKSENVFPMVQASEIDKGEAYTKQTKKGQLLETKQITFNAEYLSLVLPSSVNKNQVLDLKSFINSSVKTVDEFSPVFVINGITITGYNYTVPANTNSLSIQLHKKYANGMFMVDGTVAVN